jgi:hypothetical protein
MAHYRAYIIGRDHRVQKAEDLTCSDDEEAKKAAERFVDGHDVELWQRDRMIAKFEAKH